MSQPAGKPFVAVIRLQESKAREHNKFFSSHGPSLNVCGMSFTPDQARETLQA